MFDNSTLPQVGNSSDLERDEGLGRSFDAAPKSTLTRPCTALMSKSIERGQQLASIAGHEEATEIHVIACMPGSSATRREFQKCGVDFETTRQTALAVLLGQPSKSSTMEPSDIPLSHGLERLLSRADDIATESREHEHRMTGLSDFISSLGELPPDAPVIAMMKGQRPPSAADHIAATNIELGKLRETLAARFDRKSRVAEVVMICATGVLAGAALGFFAAKGTQGWTVIASWLTSLVS